MRAARAALALALLLPAAAPAQQRDSARADSARADSTRVQRLPAAIVTGTRLGDVDERLPAQVDKIDLHDVAPGPAEAAAALARLPGVSAFDDQGTPAQPTLEVRGFNVSPVVGVPQGVSVFLDGVRVNEADAQEVNFDLLPMDAVARVQLVRGPATLYGKNTLAGALVLFTQRGETVPVLSGELSAGSFGAYGATISAGGARNGFDAFLTANAFDESGWRDDAGTRERSIFLNLGRKRDSTDLAFTLLYAHDRILQAGSLPESLAAVNPRSNFTGGDFFEPQLWHLALRGERPLGAGTVRGALFYRGLDAEQFNVNVRAASSDALITNASYGLTGEWSANLRAFASPLALTVGAELSRSDVHEMIYAQIPAGSADTLPSGCDPVSFLCADVKVPETDAGLFAQAVLQLSPALSLTAALRGDGVRLPFQDLTDSANSGTSTYTHLSPRVGANFAISGTVRGYANIGGGFRAPAPVELGCADQSAPCPLPYALGDDPPLAPVTLTSYEVGADWEPQGGSTLEASLFLSDVDNDIVFVASTATAGYFKNIPRTRRQGIEVTGTLALPYGLRASASYAYVQATYQSTVALASALPTDTARPGDVFPLSPRERVTLSLGAAEVVGRGTIGAELGMNAVSTQYLRGDDANTEAPLPGYAVWRLRVSYQRSHLAVTATVRNLFDRAFSSFGTYADNPLDPPADQPERFYTPAAPRSYVLALTLSR